MTKDQSDPTLTSEEAAALWLSNGATSDPFIATSGAYELDGEGIKMDDYRKAKLRDMMGFDFRIKVKINKVHVSSKQDPYVTTHCKIKEGELDKYGNIISEPLIDRLVDACLRLKLKYEAEVARLEAAQ